jgi:hypothetical protein
MIGPALNSLYLVFGYQESGSLWGRFDNKRMTFDGNDLLIIGGATLLVLCAFAWQLLLRRRHQRDFWFDSTSRLFAELCRAHKLARSNRRLLKQLAIARGLGNANVLFVEPDHFDATDLPPELKESASDLRQLRHKLFD